jgi:hypothetical protein
MNHLLLSDVNVLVMQLKEDFPEIFKVRSIGKTWHDRKILMFEIDAREEILSKTDGGADIKELTEEKPAILITGAHHAREVMSVQLPMYAILRMLHGYVHNDPYYTNLLAQNKYYVVPVVNVDGLAFVEEGWNKEHELKIKRKNMNPNLLKYNLCPDLTDTGVDLNRNYGVDWNKPGGNSDEPCAQDYRGTAPFSEPETRAIRDFLITHQDEVKFVYNFHSFGNMYLWPYNGSSPNNIEQRSPGALDIFMEIWNDSTFPIGTMKGNAFEALNYHSSGEQSDWILGALGIPSICPEVGSSDYFSFQWNIPYRKVVINILEENINWIENTFKKIGNQVKITPIGYQWVKKLANGQAQVIAIFNVSNHGLADQVMKNHKVEITTKGVHVNAREAGSDKTNDSHFFINKMKKRTSQIEAVLLNIDDPNDSVLKGMFTQQPLDLDIEYAEYATMSPNVTASVKQNKNNNLKLKPLGQSDLMGLTGFYNAQLKYELPPSKYSKDAKTESEVEEMSYQEIEQYLVHYRKSLGPHLKPINHPQYHWVPQQDEDLIYYNQHF